eukprot:scaffold143422_cov21-Tisochrysis_lutea.AAC.2
MLETHQNSYDPSALQSQHLFCILLVAHSSKLLNQVVRCQALGAFNRQAQCARPDALFKRAQRGEGKHVRWLLDLTSMILALQARNFPVLYTFAYELPGYEVDYH